MRIFYYIDVRSGSEKDPDVLIKVDRNVAYSISRGKENWEYSPYYTDIVTTGDLNSYMWQVSENEAKAILRLWDKPI